MKISPTEGKDGKNEEKNTHLEIPVFMLVGTLFRILFCSVFQKLLKYKFVGNNYTFSPTHTHIYIYIYILVYIHTLNDSIYSISLLVKSYDACDIIP